MLNEHPAGLTDRELADLLGERDRLASVVRRRADAGAVDSGRRRLTPSGHEAIVWRLP